MNRILCAVALASAMVSPARAEEPPPLELAPLLPPKAPWLKKNQKKQAPDAQAKKSKRKKGAPPQPDLQKAPLVEAPPLALPPLVQESSAPQVAEPGPPPAAATQPSALPSPAAVAEPVPPPNAVVVPAKPQPPAPPAAVAVEGAPAAPRRWTRPAGVAALGVSAALAVAGTYFGVKSHSDLGSAETAFHANGGVYRPGDLATLNSGNSAAHSANALFIASGALLAAGALLTWAF